MSLYRGLAARALSLLAASLLTIPCLLAARAMWDAMKQVEFFVENYKQAGSSLQSFNFLNKFNLHPCKEGFVDWMFGPIIHVYFFLSHNHRTTIVEKVGNPHQSLRKQEPYGRSVTTFTFEK